MKIKYIILTLLTTLFFACSDWLDVDSKVILTDEDIQKFPELAEAQFLSNYAELRKSIHSVGDGALSYRQHHLESFTDDGASNIDWEAGVMRNNSPGLVYGGIFSQSSGETFTPVWNYKTINVVNKFIETYNSSTDEQILNTVGEALFIRSYLYFEMVKRYGGVPLFSGSLENVTSINKRAKEEESWDFILNSLDSAILLLPDAQKIIAEDKDRANKFTALALKSRAMLYAGTIAKYGTVTNNGLQGIPENRAKDYLSEAASAANEVINHSNNKYQLSSEFGDLFNGKDEDNDEIIFRFRNSVKSGTQVFLDFWNQSFRIKREGYTAFMVPSLDIVEQFETLNGEIMPLEYNVPKNNLEDFFANRDKRLAATVIYPGGEFLGERFSIYKKTIVEHADGSSSEYFYNNQQEWSDAGKVPGYDEFMKSGYDGIFFNNSGMGTTNYGFFLKKTLYGLRRQENYLNHENDQDAVILRFGEVILNYAEAAAELTTMGDATYIADAQTRFDLLRLVHGGLPPKVLTIQSVRNERRIDLLYEGFRYWDQKRWRIGTQMHNKTLRALHPILHIDETENPVRIYYTIESADAPALATRVKWFEERDYYCPVPTEQNPGIIQNIGWE